MDTAHRKIELQSPSDLTFLTSQIRTAARQKLDLHLPPVVNDGSAHGDEPDELRKHVEELVDAFVANVLNAMRHNISINGIDVVAAAARGGEEIEGAAGVLVMDDEAADSQVEQEDFEAFDEKLRTKLSTTVQRRDALISKISQHRRSTPAAAALAWQKQFEAESEALLRAQVEGDMGGAGEEDGLGLEALVRAEEVQRNWERAVEGLGRLNKGLPETRARLERCGDVVGYLGGEGKK
ncbi:Nn.00g111470.m01.CDS01 [Neocucurbitaria sp. VM-36]